MQSKQEAEPRQEAERRFSAPGKDNRIVWSRLALAAGLTAAQFAFLFMAWQGAEQDYESSPAVTAVALPLDPEKPPPPPPPGPPGETVPDQFASGSTSPPAPRPVTRPFEPPPRIVLTEVTVPPAPPTDFPPSRIAGEGESDTFGLGIGPGEGVGTGSGTGAGSGAGGGTAPPPARRLTTTWAPDMRFDLLHRRYPSAARAADIAGVAQLECEVLRRGRVRDCRLLGQVPAGHGFGDAALRAQPIYRIRVHDQNGDRVYNERVILNAYFRPRR